MYAFALSALSFIPFVIYPAYYPLAPAAVLGYCCPTFYYCAAFAFLPSSPPPFPFA